MTEEKAQQLDDALIPLIFNIECLSGLKDVLAPEVKEFVATTVAMSEVEYSRGADHFTYTLDVDEKVVLANQILEAYDEANITGAMDRLETKLEDFQVVVVELRECIHELRNLLKSFVLGDSIKPPMGKERIIEVGLKTLRTGIAICLVNTLKAQGEFPGKYEFLTERETLLRMMNPDFR